MQQSSHETAVSLTDYPETMLQILTYPESSKTMRYSRPWYLLPFWVNLTLLFSLSQLVSIIDKTVNDDDAMFPLPSWIIYATIAVVTPGCLAVCRLLSDPAIPLLIGSLFTTFALLLTSFETSISQVLIFSLLTGIGLALSFQAIFLAISPYFIKKSICTSVITLMVSMVIMVGTFPLMNYASQALDTKLFLYLSPLAFVTSLIPFQIYLYHRYRTKSTSTEKESSHYISFDSDTLFNTKDIENLKENSLGTLMAKLKNIFSGDTWKTSFVSVLVWLSWGAAADTSWMSMGWRYQYFQFPTSLSALQMLLCFILLGVKLVPEIFRHKEASCRSNLASNYMQLGLLGVGGILLCVIPEHSHQFHNHLLFTVGLAQQYDDLTDLYLLPKNGLSFQSSQYQLIRYKLSFVVKEGEKYKLCSLWNVFCLLCHMMSILLMSCLAMILGIQIANAIGFLTTITPLNYLCSRGGLLTMSTAAICISLLRPDTWVGHKHALTIV
ncbi:uncharacterized protein LOC106068946 isoform X1 [Biomphalaria glabrata]|uniref:Uncharacterized protein LOC106068946 isoform X1 n=2 Tax=Biomphalaria glabrata TaxID=6526 RepID=A0A9U8EDY3_BIOGL|nr:uncharacterized protein LOC106068946 isoform X1 [Biomphalaria glabrata]XP_013083915.2 uncharacterized protein LOC106068946 isoform X1 [Biomphalaria glabrata]XP_013083916.2 uncharacterized protein LOC106068946 isoform X1 [Biomphalaria glabrata]XP_013083918.2 uncharacterized protein LOC106068946 isoform X1 [Biomphalaria glabrata]XP_013083919.2 uncharacterized protein LOC106068946 isoform X1 [Biomphalaria glabrata]XP_055886380.1 uncharacterized protein LOC106068946 isoform X1 [Biomphalaria gla